MLMLKGLATTPSLFFCFRNYYSYITYNTHTVIKAHSIKLYPTSDQAEFFCKSAGVSRFAYNWGLNKWKELRETNQDTSAYSLIKELNSIKREQFPWMLDVGKCACQYPIHNIQSAFRKMWKEGAGYPKFKKKGKATDSFVTAENKEQFKLKDRKLWVAKLGYVKCAENLRFEGKVNNVVIKRKANYWFAIVNIDTQVEPVVSNDKRKVGVDLGIKTLATCSNGMVFENPKALNKASSRLALAQRRVSRKVKGSANRKKQIKVVAKIHYKVSCIRNNALNQATTRIVNSAGIIVLEDLNVSGMLKNHKLSKALSDVSFGEFRRQIEYKAKWQGKQVVFADTFYPSSKTCSCCGFKKKELKLSERIFNCEDCGFSMDRDLNAATNLANYCPTDKASGSNASLSRKEQPLMAVTDGDGGIKNKLLTV